MKKVLIGGLGVVVVAVIGLVVVVSTQPDTTTVVRSATMPGTPEDAFAVVADLGQFSKWSPWDKRDPNIEVVLSEQTAAVGSTYEWSGNEEVGSGKMTITALEPPRVVVQELRFIEPFESTAQVRFLVEPVEEGSTVSWEMTTQNDFMAKAMGLMMDMDAMIGADFEAGLEALRPLVAEQAAARAEAEEAERGARSDQAMADKDAAMAEPGKRLGQRKGRPGR